MNLVKLLFVMLLLTGCASDANYRQASIKIFSPPAGMYLKVSLSHDDNFELHHGDPDWEVTRGPLEVLIIPVLTDGEVILGKTDLIHTPGNYTKNQASCSMKPGFTAKIDVVGYQEATCAGNAKTVIQKGDTEASSVVFSFGVLS